MELLIAQCSDLESLLALARRETLAAEENDFNELMTVARDRATLGERLQSYHEQIAELRAMLGRTAEPIFGSTVAQEAVRLAVEIQALDARTTTMLATTQAETRQAIACLDQGRRNFVAYLQTDARASGFNCDRSA
jgi:hypothetical protein